MNYWILRMISTTRTAQLARYLLTMKAECLDTPLHVTQRFYTRCLYKRIYKTEMKFWAAEKKNLPTAISKQGCIHRIE